MSKNKPPRCRYCRAPIYFLEIDGIRRPTDKDGVHDCRADERQRYGAIAAQAAVATKADFE